MFLLCDSKWPSVCPSISLLRIRFEINALVHINQSSYFFIPLSVGHMIKRSIIINHDYILCVIHVIYNPCRLSVFYVLFKILSIISIYKPINTSWIIEGRIEIKTCSFSNVFIYFYINFKFYLRYLPINLSLSHESKKVIQFK